VNRRELLKTAMTGTAGFALIGVHRACLAQADFEATVRHPFLTQPQRESIATITELIIPQTDTPGAIEAGVPQFIELMLSDWYTPDERQSIDVGLDALDTRCTDKWNLEFTGCSTAQQVEVLTEVQDSHFFDMLKQLTVYGYYTSEVGANAELIFNPMPGRYTTIDFADVGRQWVN